MSQLTANLREQIIDWIVDCQWRDIETREDAEDLTDAQLIKGINKNYCGGLEQFIKDGEGV